jgi:hypothetical protein
MGVLYSTACSGSWQHLRLLLCPIDSCPHASAKQAHLANIQAFGTATATVANWPRPQGGSKSKGLSRAVQRTRRRRPVGGRTPVGLAAGGGARRRWLGCWARRRRGSRRPAVERLGERYRPRAWSRPGPARGRPVLGGGGGAALLGRYTPAQKNKSRAALPCTLQSTELCRIAPG